MAILCGLTEDQNLWQKLNWGGGVSFSEQDTVGVPATGLCAAACPGQAAGVQPGGQGGPSPQSRCLSEYRTQVTMGVRILASVRSAELADKIILETSAVFLTAAMARTCKLEGLHNHQMD